MRGRILAGRSKSRRPVKLERSLKSGGEPRVVPWTGHKLYLAALKPSLTCCSRHRCTVVCRDLAKAVRFPLGLPHGWCMARVGVAVAFPKDLVETSSQRPTHDNLAIRLGLVPPSDAHVTRLSRTWSVAVIAEAEPLFLDF